MLYKICRLCPSTSKWAHPTKKVGENKKAYTSEFGFGFEEWLNREEWLLSGYPGLDGEWRYACSGNVDEKQCIRRPRC